jgi:hypothetical protein
MFAAPTPLYVQGIIALTYLSAAYRQDLILFLKKLNDMLVDNHFLCSIHLIHCFN